MCFLILVLFSVDWQHSKLSCFSFFLTTLCTVTWSSFLGRRANHWTLFDRGRCRGNVSVNKRASLLFMRRVLLLLWFHGWSENIFLVVGSFAWKVVFFSGDIILPPPRPSPPPPPPCEERFLWCHADGRRRPFSFCTDPGAVCWASMLLEFQPVLTFHWAHWRGPWTLYAVDLDLKQNNKKNNYKELLLILILFLMCRLNAQREIEEVIKSLWVSYVVYLGE